MPTTKNADDQGLKPFIIVNYNAIKVRIWRGVFNNTEPEKGPESEAYVIYDNLAINFRARMLDTPILAYGFKNGDYVRKNPINVTIPFGGYSVAAIGGDGRVRATYLENYASVIYRMDGTPIIDAWTKAGQGVSSDFIRLNGISRLRLGHRFGYSWDGDIVG